jgi:hypothetical protein
VVFLLVFVCLLASVLAILPSAHRLDADGKYPPERLVAVLLGLTLAVICGYYLVLYLDIALWGRRLFGSPDARWRWDVLPWFFAALTSSLAVWAGRWRV